MASIGDLFLRLLVDDKGFSADVEKKAGAAGDKAGKTLGQRMGTAAKAGLTVFGTGAGALFGIAAGKANELTNAMAEFQRETGATQEELASAQKSVVSLSRSNLQSFDEIARAQAALRTDLGLTQAEAEAATQQFLDYGTATGRDATEGVKSLDDILDAWNLDSSKSGEIMDKLVASHQKYGGSIAENEKALATLAPQLQALGASTDDGIELLNLFAASGLDASKATAALNTAVKGLKPGQNLDDLVSQIAAIEDPTARAQKAIEVFGARGGVALANALKPGVESLDQFGVTAEEIDGAVTDASDAIKNTPFNQFTLAVKNMVGPLAEAGTHFAPLILAFSQLGGGKLVAAATAAIGGFAGRTLPKLLGALSKPFAGLFTKAVVGPIGFALEEGIEGGVAKAGKSGKVAGALGKLGDFMGSKLGKGLSIAFAAIAVVEVVNTYNQVRDGLNQQTTQITSDIGNQIKSGTTESLQQSASALQAGISQLEGLWWNPFAGEQRAKLEADLAATMAELERRSAEGAAAVPPAIAGELARGDGAVEASAKHMADQIPEAVTAAKKQAAKVARQTPGEIADGIRSRRDAVDSAMADLQEAMENPMNVTKERAKLVGLLTSTELANGLRSQDPLVRRTAEATRELLLTQLHKLPLRTKTIGAEGEKALAEGLKSKDPLIRGAAEHIRSVLDRKFESYDGAKWGEDLGNEYALGLRRSAAAVRAAGNYVAGVAAGPLRPSSPPKEGPLHTIDKWGAMYMAMIARGIVSARRMVTEAGAYAVGGLGMPSVPPMSARLGAFLPSAPPQSAGVALSAAAGLPGSATTINVNLLDRMETRSVRDIGAGLRMLEREGYFTPRPYRPDRRG